MDFGPGVDLFIFGRVLGRGSSNPGGDQTTRGHCPCHSHEGNPNPHSPAHRTARVYINTGA